MPLEKRSLLSPDRTDSELRHYLEQEPGYAQPEQKGRLVKIPPLFFIKNARDTGEIGLIHLAHRAKLAELLQDGFAKMRPGDPEADTLVQEMITFLAERNPSLQVFELVDPEWCEDLKN